MRAGGETPRAPREAEEVHAAAVFLTVMPRWAQACFTRAEAEAIVAEVERLEPTLRGRAGTQKINGWWWVYIAPEVP